MTPPTTRTTRPRKSITELEDEDAGAEPTPPPAPAPRSTRATKPKAEPPPPPSPEDLGMSDDESPEDSTPEAVEAEKAPAPRRVTSYSRIIEGIVTVDVNTAHAEILEALGPSEPKTGAELQVELDRLPRVWLLACELAARARADYEKEKERLKQEIEPMRDAAQQSLDEDKESGKLKGKRLSEVMVLDRIRAVWGEKYADLIAEERELQAAVHVLEKLPKAIEMRLSALEKMSEIRGNLGAMPARPTRA